MTTESVATTTTEPDWNAMDPQEFADVLAERVIASSAPLTCKQMDQIETQWRNDIRARRCALVMLVKSGNEIVGLTEKSREFAESAAEVQQHLPRLIEFHKGMISLFEQVNVRLMVALAGREDMQQLLDTAKAEFEAA